MEFMNSTEACSMGKAEAGTSSFISKDVPAEIANTEGCEVHCVDLNFDSANKNFSDDNDNDNDDGDDDGDGGDDDDDDDDESIESYKESRQASTPFHKDLHSSGSTSEAGSSGCVSDSDDSNASPNTTSDETRSNSSTSCGGSSVRIEKMAMGTHDKQAYIAGTFEGPEKTMEIIFRNGVGSDQRGLRSLKRSQLDKICAAAKCTIMSKMCNNHLDAYVLSESSLFVYTHRLVMKTCGTTTLLRCIGTILSFADEMGMELTWLGYSRKNLFFPTEQQWPHSNFGDEMKYLDTHEKLQNRLQGVGHILGPITGDHWFDYVNPRRRTTDPYVGDDRTINMMMFDMAPSVASQFYIANSPGGGKEMTKKSGIATLCPGAKIDERSFVPCGYSMNAILHESYYTIHITPEPECSYVSFETNASLTSYSALVRNVLRVFKPRRFLLTTFGDDEALKALQQLPTDPRVVDTGGHGVYNRTSLAASSMANGEEMAYLANYTLDLSTAKGLDDDADLVPITVPPAEFPHGFRQRPRGQSLGDAVPSLKHY
eukprot:GSChrysophyteH1.ASY1.ANO1.1589.1 assembled CDS